MKKLTSLLLAVLLLAMAIPSMAEEPVHLRIATWTSNEDQLKLLGSFVDEFAQAKGIAIEPEFISLSGTEYSSLLLMNLQSNEPADAFWVMEADIKAHLPQTFLRHLADDLAPCAEDDLRAAGRQPVNDAQRQTDCTAHNSNFSREIKHLTNGRQTLKRTCGHLKHHFLIHQIILFLCIFA